MHAVAVPLPFVGPSRAATLHILRDRTRLKRFRWTQVRHADLCRLRAGPPVAPLVRPFPVDVVHEEAADVLRPHGKAICPPFVSSVATQSYVPLPPLLFVPVAPPSTPKAGEEKKTAQERRDLRKTP